MIDLIQTITRYKVNEQIKDYETKEISKLNRFYIYSMYNSLLYATKFSLN